MNRLYGQEATMPTSSAHEEHTCRRRKIISYPSAGVPNIGACIIYKELHDIIVGYLKLIHYLFPALYHPFLIASKSPMLQPRENSYYFVSPFPSTNYLHAPRHPS